MTTDINEHGRALRIGEVLQEGDTFYSKHLKKRFETEEYGEPLKLHEYCTDYRRPLHLDKPAVQVPAEKCLWSQAHGDEYFFAACRAGESGYYHDAMMNNWKHCPYCGKEIERKVEG